jgi:hypothetical protein
MMRRLATAAVAVLLFGAGLSLGGLLAGRAARAQESPPENEIIRIGLDGLERINRMLREAIDDYEEGRIDEEGLRRRIRRILERKKDVVADLFRWYTVYGDTFARWYFVFSALDRRLDEAYLRSQLEEILGRRQISGPLRTAKEVKESIERDLRERLRELEGG